MFSKPAAGRPGLLLGLAPSVEIPSHAQPLITFQPNNFPDSPGIPFVLRGPPAPSLMGLSLGLKASDPRLGLAKMGLGAPRVRLRPAEFPFSHIIPASLLGASFQEAKGLPGMTFTFMTQ